MTEDLERVEDPGFPVLIDRSTIQSRIREIAASLLEEERSPYMVAVLEGARIFARALCHHMGMAVPEFDTVRVSSYGDGTVSSGEVKVVEDLEGSIVGKRVLLIEDIVDSGRTVDCLTRLFLERGAASVEIVTLLSKPSRRLFDVELAHVGFEIPDAFVLGFGMDVAGRFRDLPHIAVYEEELDDAEQRA